MKRALLIGTGVLALIVPAAAQAFTPNDPLLPKQWYAPQDRAFDAFNILPLLPTVRVAVIDSGVDVSHPDLRGQIRAARSFVGGSPADDQGHGTFVAGEIAAAVDDGHGIAGLAPAANLLVAKVVRPDGSVSTRAEARAIRWAVKLGARVINVSGRGRRENMSSPGAARSTKTGSWFENVETSPERPYEPTPTTCGSAAG